VGGNAWNPQETCREWRVRDRSGRETTCGFIASVTQPFCSACRRIRITRWRPAWCLASNVRHDLCPVLQAGAPGESEKQLHAILRSAFGNKRTAGFTEAVESMCLVGG